MDQKSRCAQLGKAALDYAVQRYLYKYPEITCEELNLITKLVSSRTFLTKSTHRSVADFGEMCVKSGIKSVETHVDLHLGPQIAVFMGLDAPQSVASVEPDLALETPISLDDLKSPEIVSKLFSDSPPLCPETAESNLFDEFSDEALLRDSSFASQGREPIDDQSVQSHDPSESTKFDLLDADSWYKKP